MGKEEVKMLKGQTGREPAPGRVALIQTLGGCLLRTLVTVCVLVVALLPRSLYSLRGTAYGVVVISVLSESICLY